MRRAHTIWTLQNPVTCLFTSQLSYFYLTVLNEIACVFDSADSFRFIKLFLLVFLLLYITSKAFRNVWKFSKGPVIWSRVPETTLPQRQLYWVFIYENVVPVGRVKVNPTWLFITLTMYWIIKCANIPLSLSFPRSSDHIVLCRVNFHFFDTNFCFKYET